MDHDKDGIIGKEDLVFIFDQVGKVADDAEIDGMLEDSEEPLNFTQMLTMFAGRLQGGTFCIIFSSFFSLTNLHLWRYLFIFDHF